MKKISIIFVLITLIFIYCTGCGNKNNSYGDSNKISVVSTVFVPYDFVREISDDNVNITMLIPPASESHSFEPTPQDIIKIQNCDIFIYVGGDSDSWVDGVLSSIDISNTKIVTLMDCVDLVTEEIVEGMEDDHGHDHSHGHGEIDPDKVKNRPMSDFDGSWISAIPLINNGSLDAYIEHTAEENGLTVENQKTALSERWASDYDSIIISDNKLSSNGSEAEYEYKGFDVIESEQGISVWYKYQIIEINSNLPAYLAFNDHSDGNTEDEHDSEEHEEIAHMHMRYGNDGFEALINIEGWSPYYFDNNYSHTEIVDFMFEHSHGNHDEEEVYDEHVWTSPRNAKLIVQKISDVICSVDTLNADKYRANTAVYLERLDELDNAFREVVDNAVRKTIVFGDRFPFRYFADAYGLEYFAAFPGCSTETEASAKTIAFLIDKVKDEKIPVVFHIELSNEKMADTICEAAGAKKLLMHSCHNISKNDFQNGVTYIDLMYQNVDALKEALH